MVWRRNSARNSIASPCRSPKAPFRRTVSYASPRRNWSAGWKDCSTGFRPPCSLNRWPHARSSSRCASSAVCPREPAGPADPADSVLAPVNTSKQTARAANRSTYRNPRCVGGVSDLRRQIALDQEDVPGRHDRAQRIRSEEHTSELQSPYDLVCRLLLEKKKKKITRYLIQKKKKIKHKVLTIMKKQ